MMPVAHARRRRVRQRLVCHVIRIRKLSSQYRITIPTSAIRLVTLSISVISYNKKAHRPVNNYEIQGCKYQINMDDKK